MQTGQRVQTIKGIHAGRTGTVTKVNGPKTVEVRIDSGFMLWNVKITNLEGA